MISHQSHALGKHFIVRIIPSTCQIQIAEPTNSFTDLQTFYYREEFKFFLSPYNDIEHAVVHLKGYFCSLLLKHT